MHYPGLWFLFILLFYLPTFSGSRWKCWALALILGECIWLCSHTIIRIPAVLGISLVAREWLLLVCCSIPHTTLPLHFSSNPDTLLLLTLLKYPSFAMEKCPKDSLGYCLFLESAALDSSTLKKEEEYSWGVQRGVVLASVNRWC